jgi:hypothetical protein
MTFGATDNTKNLVTIKGVENIVYVGVNNLSTGTSAADAAKTAKATADAAVLAAAGTKADADANLAAFTAVHAIAAIAASGSGSTAVLAQTIEEQVLAATTATVTIGSATTYTAKQLNAAAKAVQSAATVQHYSLLAMIQRL